VLAVQGHRVENALSPPGAVTDSTTRRQPNMRYFARLAAFAALITSALFVASDATFWP
jgi:hypothetical protein